MIIGIFAVKDTKAGAFMQPWVSPNIPSAVRSFAEALRDNRADNPISKWPEDHVLYHLATWDDATGIITPLEAPQSLGIATQFKDN